MSKGNDLIEKYHVRFRRNLIGKWATSEGTFCMMSEYFEFFSDGTGIWEDKDDIVKFNWREKADFEMEILETWASYWEDDDKEDSSEWHTIHYNFKFAENDCGTIVILYSDDRDHFYFAHTRLAFCGTI